MTRALRIIASGSLVALFLVGNLAAEDVKLRPLRPIYLDSLGAALNNPEDVAYDGSSLLVVADTGNRRFVLFEVGKDSISPTAEFRLSEVPLPARVRFDPAGEILALDGKSHRIARITRAGAFKSFVEIAPAEGRRATTVKSFDVGDDGSLYVLDVVGSRIVVLDGKGALVRTIAFAPEVEFLSGLAVNSSGVVFAIDSVGRKVFVARSRDEALTPLTETMEQDLAFPTSIAADSTGFLYVSDRSGGGIVILGENGTFHRRQSSRGRGQGFLRDPSGLQAAGEYLFVADRGNNRVQVFLITR